MGFASRRKQWTVNIDPLLNRIIPPPPWKYVPVGISHFFGYRREQVQDVGNVMVTIWAFVGIFASLAVIQAASLHVASLQAHGAPLIVGSFGAAAVLEFYSIGTPLAQPRNSILGHILSTVVGVAVSKLFGLSPRLINLQWLGGALACAVATAAMALTNTIHPPAGATALLAVVDDDIAKLGWFLIPVIMLGCTLMLAVALFINNIDRRFPMYWWTSTDLSTVSMWTSGQGRGTGSDVETGSEKAPASDADETSTSSDARGSATEAGMTGQAPGGSIVIRSGGVSVPDDIFLSVQERRILDDISQRLL